jgi:hypothetical protein
MLMINPPVLTGDDRYSYTALRGIIYMVIAHNVVQNFKAIPPALPKKPEKWYS